MPGHSVFLPLRVMRAVNVSTFDVLQCASVLQPPAQAQRVLALCYDPEPSLVSAVHPRADGDFGSQSRAQHRLVCGFQSGFVRICDVPTSSLGASPAMLARAVEARLNAT